MIQTVKKYQSFEFNMKCLYFIYNVLLEIYLLFFCPALYQFLLIENLANKLSSNLTPDNISVE